MNAIEGHFVSGYADGGDAPDRQLHLVPGALEEARAFLENEADTQARLATVADLVDGFESPFGLELLATVHWIGDREAKVPDLDELTRRVYGWNERKKRFSPRQIELAFPGAFGQELVHSSQPSSSSTRRRRSSADRASASACLNAATASGSGGTFSPMGGST